MRYYYIKRFFRDFKKNPITSFINISGLALGICFALFIFQYTSFEISYDQHYPNHENIVRVSSEWFQNDAFMEHRAASVPGMHQLFRNGYPEVENYARYHKGSTNVVRYSDANSNSLRRFEEKKIFYADPAFAQVFDLSFNAGKMFDDEPNKLIISSSTAERFFSDKEAIGRLLLFDGEFSFQAEVVGVFEDFPENTHLKGDFILSLATKEKLVPFDITDNWIWRSFYTYLELESGTDIENLEQKINQYVKDTKTEYYGRGNYWVNFHIQKLTDIHLYSDLFEEIKVNGSIASLKILGFSGFFLLLISFFNFVNLTTAKNLKRLKEVSIKKYIGAQRELLIREYLLESIFLVFVSTLLGVCLVQTLFPVADKMYDLNFDLSILLQPLTWFLLFGFVFVAGILSGYYPAFILSSTPFTTLLKGSHRSKKGQTFKRVLVGFQFALSFGLILGLTTILHQMNHMRSRELGIHKEQVLSVNGPKIKNDDYTSQLNLFKTTIENNASISRFSTVSTLPGEVTGAGRDFRDGEGNRSHLKIIRVDYDFEKVFDLDVVAGRTYAPDFPSGDAQIILNQSAIKKFNLNEEEALNSVGLTWSNVGEDSKSKILGVVKDYYPDAQSDPVPTAFVLNRHYSAPWDPEIYVFRLLEENGEDRKNALNEIEAFWNESFSQDPFSYQFVNDFYNQQFKKEEQLSNLTQTFSFAAIFLACIGLVALVSFNNQSKMKEIGIRKVLGSSSWKIQKMLVWSSSKPIIIGSLLSIPIIYFLMEQWLENYTYRVSIELKMIVVPFIGLVGLVCLIILFQSRKAVNVNPVSLLKEE